MNGRLLLILMGFAPSASAYLDPGSGSLLFASLFGIIATGFFLLKSVYYKVSSFVGRGKSGPRHTYGIVCYSEGSHYWSTFRPLVLALNESSLRVTYLTSDSCDIAFDFASDLLDVSYIGEGNRAYARLNFLNADVCILTTPGLDVLQIKRSKAVGQYVHVVHSSMDVHTYKLFSFDYYDAVLCSGQYQIDSLRALEAKRNTPRKKLLLTGCLYYDGLLEKKSRLPSAIRGADEHRVLIAPTWGRNGLLARFGERLISTLLESGYEITIRPHPHSHVMEQELLSALMATFNECRNVTWDGAPDNFASLSRADIMISDISGVMFDYVFVFARPVITIAFEPDWLGTESFDLDTEAFELTVLDRIGRRIGADDIPALPRIIEEVSRDHETGSELEAIRDRMAVNFGRGGPVAARQVMELGQLEPGGQASDEAEVLQNV